MPPVNVMIPPALLDALEALPSAAAAYGATVVDANGQPVSACDYTGAQWIRMRQLIARDIAAEKALIATMSFG